MTKKVADLLVDVLAEAGVKRIYGVVGDFVNELTPAFLTFGSTPLISHALCPHCHGS